MIRRNRPFKWSLLTIVLMIGFQHNTNVPLSESLENTVPLTNADSTAGEGPLRTKPTISEKSWHHDTWPIQNLTTIISEKEPPSMTGTTLLPKCNASSSLPRNGNPAVIMTDANQKIHLSGIPKGGATVSAQIMLRYLGLMEEALAYNPWIHKYRWKVFAQKPGHRPVGCQTIDCESWLCIKIVRSVVDRAVSSYIHTTKHAPHNGVPFSILFKMARNSGIKPEESPFRLFLEALHRNAKTPKGYQDAHYLPQADRNCDSAPGMHLVPLEGLQESLDIIHQTRGIYLNASGLTSHHYISKPATSNTTNLEPKASSLLYSDLFSSKGKFKFAYDDMFDTEEVKQLFCQVYCHDIALYAKLCRQPMVQSNALLTSVCERERQRIMAICQVDYFQN